MYLCGKQGIFLRGHRDDSTASQSINHGNFLELLRFRSDGGDLRLTEHLTKCRRNATYTSKTIQNELIAILGDHVRTSILDDIKRARFFSILADEVSDVAGFEQLSIVLRFVDTQCNIREEFVDFLEVERITGAVIAGAILKKIEMYGLNIADFRGQGYDGASNMSSAARGVRGIITQSSPNAVYIHCNCHVLNLSIVIACSHPSIRNMAGNISEVANFFNYSPKRQRLMEKVIAVTQPEVHKQKLHDLCRTRWVEWHQAYETFTELFPTVVSTLDVMLHEADNRQEQYGHWSWDTETLTRANGLQHVLTSFDFLMSLTTTANALASLRPLTIKLQRRSWDIVKAYKLVRATVKDLERVRANEEIMGEWFQQASTLATVSRYRTTCPANNRPSAPPQK